MIFSPMSRSTSVTAHSAGSPSNFSPSISRVGAKVRTTRVGEPSKPHRQASASMQAESHTVTSFFFAASLALMPGRRGSFICFTHEISTGIRASTTSNSSSNRRRTRAFFPSTSIPMAKVTCGIPSCSAIPGGTWAVSPSKACLPVKIRSYSPMRRMALEST